MLVPTELERATVRRGILLPIFVVAMSALPGCSSSSAPEEARVTIDVAVSGSGSGQIDAFEIELSCTVTSGASAPIPCQTTFRDPNGAGSFTMTARPSPGSILSSLVAETFEPNTAATCIGQFCEFGSSSPGGEVLFEVDVMFSLRPTQVLVTPSSATIASEGTVQLAAQALDASGAPLSGHTFTWTSSDESVAIVAPHASEATATVRGVAEGVVTITATAAAVSGASTITVDPGAMGQAIFK